MVATISDCNGYQIHLRSLLPPAPRAKDVGVSSWVSYCVGTRYPERDSQLKDEESGHRYRIDEIDDFLYTIDSKSESGLPFRQGPFSLFPSHPESLPPEVPSFASPGLGEAPPDASSHESPWEADLGANIALSTQDTPQSDLSQPTSMTLIGNELEWPLVIRNASSASPFDNEQPEQMDRVEEIMDSDSLLGADSMTDSSDAVIPYGNITLSTPSPRSPDINTPLIRSLTISLSGDSGTDSLIHHYGIHIADLLQPISHIQNTYRDLYLPTALEMSSSSLPNPTAPKAMAHTALYHSLLASSSYHIWNCDRSQTQYQRTGAKHRHQALYYLQSAVNTTIPGADYKLFMIAILSLITIGVSANPCVRPSSNLLLVDYVWRRRGHCGAYQGRYATTSVTSSMENCQSPNPAAQ